MVYGIDYATAEGLALRYVNLVRGIGIDNSDTHNNVFSYGFVKCFVRDFEEAYVKSKFPKKIKGRKPSNLALAYSFLLWNYPLLVQRTAYSPREEKIKVSGSPFTHEIDFLERLKAIEKTVDAMRNGSLRIRPAKKLSLEQMAQA